MKKTTLADVVTEVNHDILDSWWMTSRTWSSATFPISELHEIDKGSTCFNNSIGRADSPVDDRQKGARPFTIASQERDA